MAPQDLAQCLRLKRTSANIEQTLSLILQILIEYTLHAKQDAKYWQATVNKILSKWRWAAT